MRLVAAGFWGTHGAHTALLGAPVLALTLVAVGADLRRWLQATRRRPTPALVLAGLLSLVAAGVHAAVCPAHFGEAAAYGVFFAGAASAQMAWSVLAIARPRRWVLAAGLAGNLAVLALWGVTRVAGIPLGPDAGAIEAVGRLDMLATFCELGVVASCAWLLLRRRGVLAAPTAVA